MSSAAKSKEKDPPKSDRKPVRKKPEKAPAKKPTVAYTKSQGEVIVKYGKPVLQVTFKRLKCFVALFVLVFLVILLLSFNLLITAVKIRNYLGSFINMISPGDGEILPTLLALPVVLILAIDVGLFVGVYRIFGKSKRPGANQVLFIFVAAATIGVIVTVVVIFVALGHVFGSTKSIEDGILKAMEKYSVNSFYKRQMDKLQIEFQCCGSNKYDDWFNITWIEKELSTTSNLTSSQETNTPFSCCLIRTKFPCIHFDVEATGVNYYYTPESNMSIAAIGCHPRLVEKKRQIGMGVVGGLFLFVFLELLLITPARFLQTGHSLDCKFEGNSKTYMVWLIGSYSGKSRSNGPPEPPPVPPELKD